MDRAWFLGGLAVILTSLSAASAQTAQSLLANPDRIKPISSEGVQIRTDLEHREGEAPALRIDFDFTSGAGYGGVFIELPIELPENYQFVFGVRGKGPANNLELKLVDPEGLNVWWVNRRAFEWPSETMRLTNQRRHFHFAWGPSGGKPMTKLGRVEVIIAANEGGRGTVWIEDLRFAPLPPSMPYSGTPVISASSNAGSQGTLQRLLKGEAPAWTADGADPQPWLAIDFGQPRELGGLVVHRPADHTAADFDVQASDDGQKWTTIRHVRGPSALPSELSLPDLQTRWVRLAFVRSSSAQPAVSRIQLLEPPASASPNAFWKLRAARAHRGLYPRTLLDEQSFWTIIGQPDDDREALINEEGQIEVDRRGFSIEPFIVREGKLLTWADGSHEQSLRDGWQPIPTVVRRHRGLELSITAFASGLPGTSSLNVAYTLRNTTGHRVLGSLALALRPIQVLPPWQDLNITGGWTPIESIRSDQVGVLVNEHKDARRIVATPAYMLAAASYDAGDPVERLAAGISGAGESASCPQRSASATLTWGFDLAPNASATYLLAVPFHGVELPADLPRDIAAFEALVAKVAAEWTERIDRVKFRLPPAAKQFHDTFRATQAYILINQDGPGFQPGSRTYNRSWMRDGSMTSAAMLELGHDALVKRFIDWYAPYQFPSGKVPCVVDRRGADPVPEHDSNGQLIWLIANYHRYTGDADLVRRHFDRVKATVAYVESLRAQRLTDEFAATGLPRQEPGKPPVPAIAFRGLVPESISHEGYSAKPMHSFWDTLFILRGLDDAAYLAGVVGEAELARKWRSLTDDFRDSVIESIRLTQQAHGIDYLPGCVELGDFDSTSSTILLWPVNEADRFPRQWITATFDRYWKEFTRRRESTTWDAYTPYELRHVGTYVRLGQKDRAWEAMNWLFGHQRPAGWRHWAEVVWRVPTMPRMIGDMPHTWCGSDFLNAARAMFAYESRTNRRLVLLAGIPDDWFTTGVAFDDLHTEFGSLSASAKLEANDRLLIQIEGQASPPGGFELPSPLSRPIRSARINGNPVEDAKDKSLQFTTLPATIEIRY